MTTETPSWFKSSHSNNGGQCVEIAANLIAPYGVVPVRDSARPYGPTLTFPATAFTEFVATLRAPNPH